MTYELFIKTVITFVKRKTTMQVLFLDISSFSLRVVKLSLSGTLRSPDACLMERHRTLTHF